MISSRWTHAFRSLVPAWRFFDSIERRIYFEVRPLESSETGDWCRVEPVKEIGFRDFFLNPEGTTLHAFQNLLNLAFADPEDSRYKTLLEGLAFRYVQKIRPDARGFEYRLVEGD